MWPSEPQTMVDCATGQGLHLTGFEGAAQCLWATFPFFCLRMERGDKLMKAPSVSPPGTWIKAKEIKGLVKPALRFVSTHW